MNLYAACLAGCPHLGARTIRKLLHYFGSEEKIWEASDQELAKASILTEKARNSLIQYRGKMDFSHMNSLLQKWQIDVISITEDGYPALLKKTNNPPAALFYQGFEPHWDKTISIVGSRKCTSYGLTTASKLSYELAKKGVAVISGGARGIDSAAHEGALEAGGKTAVIAACGLDRVYPPENRKLFHRIIEAGGTVISEYPPGTPPLGRHFPARNRIIAGLSFGTVVVEAAERSGSLITSDFALEEGRDVFSVPGNIGRPMSKGTNRLIRNGAICCTCSRDILSEYEWDEESADRGKEKMAELTLEEETVLRYCEMKEEISAEEILMLSGLSVAMLSAILLSLELKGIIMKTGTGKFIVCTKSI